MNQRDIVVVNKGRKRAVLIDVTIPSDGSVRTKEDKSRLILGG